MLTIDFVTFREVPLPLAYEDASSEFEPSLLRAAVHLILLASRTVLKVSQKFGMFGMILHLEYIG